MDYSSEAFSGLRILGIWWMGPFTHREERKQDQRLGIKTCEVHHLPIALWLIIHAGRWCGVDLRTRVAILCIVI